MADLLIANAAIAATILASLYGLCRSTNVEA